MKPILPTLCFLLFSSAVLAAPGTMTRDEELRSSASAGGAVVGRVAKGAVVEILARQGGWTQVSGAGKTGWVRILAVKSSAPSGAAGDVLGIVEAGTTRRDPGKVVAVAGLRGLNEEELKQARFNAHELLRLDGYASDRADAEHFARAAKLEAARVPYLPNPAREQRQKDNPSSPWGEGGL